MKKAFVKGLIFSLAIGIQGCASGIETVDYIDPFIGTDGMGHTTPAATTPFGMVQLGPSIDYPWDWKRTSGYHYSDNVIKGFAHNHISGAGLSALGDILIMATTGEVQTDPGTLENPDLGYASRFSHDEEHASAGYYSVRLADYGINAEFTATPRTGCHRYTVDHSDKVNIIIDPIHGIWERDFIGEVQFISPTEVIGYKQCKGEGGSRRAYFYARFSRPYDEHGVASDGVRYPDRDSVNSSTAKGYASFDMREGENLEMAVALSSVSYEGAKANYDAESRGKSFRKIHREARKLWQEKCDKFEMEGTEEEKRVFYTSVYHSFFSPNLISDVTGDYVVEGKLLHSDTPQYSNYSTWDTYRATHPLFTIVEQEKTAEFVNSLASRYTDAGVGLPLWECLGHDNLCMIGRSPVAIMTEAILKDIPGIAVDDAYDAMYSSLMATDKHSVNYGTNNGMASYLECSYVTGDVGCAVSKTTEYNYYDYAFACVADKLGNKEDAEYFHKRSLGHRELWNKDKNYLWPKYADGTWKDIDMSNWDELIQNYISGNIWGYSTYVPHDMDYMMELIGGKAEYVKWLDGIFSDNTVIGGVHHVDISGFIGKYGHGDEPSHQMPYLYALAGAPEKTQAMVDRISREMYNDTPNGLVNNDDLGQMSSWYIFSSLGFYPVNPASCTYVLGRPLYSKAAVNMENGNRLEIRAENWNHGSYLVEKVLMNGKELTDWTVSHSDLMAGGELVFVMK